MFEGRNVKVLLSQAGSGKTRRLIEEVSKELETRRPEELAFVTLLWQNLWMQILCRNT